MSNDVSRLKANYLTQKERYERTLASIEHAKQKIIDYTKYLAKAQADLPTYKKYYENSEREFRKVGNVERQNKLSQMDKLRKQLEAMTGESVPIKALDELKSNNELEAR